MLYDIIESIESGIIIGIVCYTAHETYKAIRDSIDRPCVCSEGIQGPRGNGGQIVDRPSPVLALLTGAAIAVVAIATASALDEVSEEISKAAAKQAIRKSVYHVAMIW